MSSLTILSRSKWSARPRRCNVTERSLSSIHTLVVHWPGETGSLKRVDTDVEERAMMRAWQTFHMNGNGWCDIGYNLVLFPNWGRPKQPCNVYTARGVQYTPAAQEGANTGTLAVMVALGAEDSLTDDVKARLRSVVRWAESHVGHELKVKGHRDFGGTACPGEKLYSYVKTLDRV